MSKQANKTVIGIFVVGAIALVIAAVLIFGSGKFFKPTFKVVCYFEGSVGGLNVGAPVVFRGVRIGSVTDIALRFDTKNMSFTIPVYLQLQPDKVRVIGPLPKRLGQNLKTFIDQGLRARLEMQSIVTGQMQVGLDFYPNKPAVLVGADTKTPEIPTIQTPLQELAKKLEKIPIEQIFEELSSTLDGINKVVKSPEIPEAIHSVKLAAENTRKLIQNVDGRLGPLASNLNETVQDIRRLVQNADGKVTRLTSNLDETLKDVRGLVKNVDTKVDRLASSLDETVKETRGAIRHVDKGIGPVMASVDKTMKSADETLSLAQRAIEGIEGTVGEDSALIYQLTKTLEEVRAMARSIRVLADYLERHPESLLRGK